MKFTDRLKQVKREMFPSEADLEADAETRYQAQQAEIEAARQAAAEVAQQLKLAAAAKLALCVNRLVVVTNCDRAGNDLDTNTTRVVDDLVSKQIFQPEQIIGLSFFSGLFGDDMTSELRRENTANVLSEKLSLTGFTGILPASVVKPKDGLIAALAQSTERGASKAQAETHDIGHIVVLSAMDLRNEGMGYYEGGTAFQLTGVTNDKLDWQAVSVHPDDAWKFEVGDLFDGEG